MIDLKPRARIGLNGKIFRQSGFYKIIFHWKICLKLNISVYNFCIFFTLEQVIVPLYLCIPFCCILYLVPKARFIMYPVPRVRYSIVSLYLYIPLYLDGSRYIFVFCIINLEQCILGSPPTIFYT